MTEYLAKARIENETFQAELIGRNLELAALNGVANEISRSQGLADMMRRSLIKVTEFIGVDAGWVNTLSEDGKHVNLICHIGLSDEAVREIANIGSLNCACKDAVHKKSSVVISIKNKKVTCPILNQKFENGELLIYHVAVPLVSKSNVLGLMHLASSAHKPIKTEYLSLLDAIGHQMGVAIENAKLWEEIKHREELRGYLLEETISVQEAERKRIARELHDQTGQIFQKISGIESSI